jgi:endogenous inhibitor of DNA gyrase (YacG/DUF329 family)
MSDDPRCAHCRTQPIDPRWRPFCSERCKMADLGRWLSGDYRIPGTPQRPSDDDAEAGDDAAETPARNGDRGR